MVQARSHVSKTLMGVLVAGVLLGLSACTPPISPEPSPTSVPVSPTPSAEPYAGPVVFVGDELSRFLLASDEIEVLLPGASEVSGSAPSLRQISDGGGALFVPAICGALYFEDSLGSVGVRTMSWTIADAPEHGVGRLNVLQFADEAQAQTRMDQLVAATEQCAEFEYEGMSTFTGVVQESGEGVRSLAGTLISESPQPQGWRVFHGFASVGNVLVELSHPFTGDQEFDAAAVATALAERSAEARGALIEQLTQAPPHVEEAQPQDGSTVWSDWLITATGVGPISLGVTVEDAIAAAQGAQAGEPEYEGGPVSLNSPDGSASLSLSQAGDDGVVNAILVGSDRSWESGGLDGAALPSAEGIRVGAPASDAMALYPEGTCVWVVSSAQSKYDVADRNGRLITFFLDGDGSDPTTATIVGITVEDATKRESFSFE